MAADLAGDDAVELIVAEGLTKAVLISILAAGRDIAKAVVLVVFLQASDGVDDQAVARLQGGTPQTVGFFVVVAQVREAIAQACFDGVALGILLADLPED